ncbi:MAG TPA: ABC transporter ATP-binding protein [Anaerolineae bacterium]|nr:ABC transporter ATP-binding protein [Anaerolineae bacterium]
MQALAFDLKQTVTGNRAVGLWRMMTGYRLIYLGALVSVALGATAHTATFFLLQYVVDEVLTQGQHLEQLPWLALGFVGLAAAEGLFSYLRGIWAARTSEGITLRLRNYLYDHIQRLSFTYHDHARTGELISRATSDVDAVRRFYADQAIGIGRIVALFVINFSMILRLNRTLGLLSIVVMPVVILVSYLFFGRVSKAYEAYQEQEARLSTTLQENLMGVRVVKAFARQRYEMDKFEEQNSEKYRRGKKLTAMNSFYWPFSDVLCGAQTLIVMGTGAMMATRGEITLGTYLAIIGMVGGVIWPLRNLGRLIVDVSRGLVSFGRVADIIAEEREDIESGLALPDEGGLRGEVLFDHVSFAYQPTLLEAEDPGGGDGKGPLETSRMVEVLHDISFHVKPGQTIALLGSTGSGKTSIVNLLLHFYDYQDGHIILDGRELTEISRATLRRQIGIVEQEPFLFSRSIRDNIAYGAGREVTEAEVIEAAKAAAIHDVILSFPQGYDTLVGEKGVTLSGGQRQRVAIARTLLKNPRILVLDDATSSVDTETEIQIETALERLMENRTTFVIAHRIQTVMQADWILVLDRGRIVQQGVHEELIKEEGLYRQIYQIQARIEEEVEREVAQA